MSAHRRAILRGKFQRAVRRAVIASWLSAAPPKEPAKAQPVALGGLGTVLYSFKAETPGELSVTAGEVVRVISDQSLAPEGWLLVQRQVCWLLRCLCACAHQFHGQVLSLGAVQTRVLTH